MIAGIERKLTKKLSEKVFGRRIGRLKSINDLIVEVTGLDVSLGEIVEIVSLTSERKILAEVISLNHHFVTVMPFSDIAGLDLNCSVTAQGYTVKNPVGPALCGRVLDALGQPLDGQPLPEDIEYIPRDLSPINPLSRLPIDKVFNTGVKAMDLFVPLGRGQRIGLFAGSGVGKSTLLGMICKHSSADVIIVALIGERGREVGDFIRESLGPSGLKRAVIYAATAEQPAVLRRHAAYTATATAEWFRSKGYNVLLVMDSITRFALAQREIGLAAGEPIGSRGYPPSVFALLPPLVERGGGLSGQGVITSIYTVLVEGDDHHEPISDHMRAVLDGHVMLDRHLAEKGHFPAIDVLKSISRLSGSLYKPEQKKTIMQLRKALADYQEAEDLIQLGAYEKGGNPVLDKIISLKPALDDLLMQASSEYYLPEKNWSLAATLSHHLLSGLHHAK